MKLIKEIYEQNLNTEHKHLSRQKYNVRKAARVVVCNGQKIALLHVTKKGFYKLIGGGVEDGENFLEALKREVLEESGCKVEIGEEIGLTIEYRDSVELLQISYAYTAESLGDIGEVSLTEKEINEGCELVWVDKDQALDCVNQSNPIDISGQFIVARDREILKAFLGQK